MADWVGVFFWGGEGGRKGAHSRKYGNWPLYDNDMATGIRKKSVNGYGGMQEPVKFRRNIRVIFVTSCQTPLKCSVRGP